MTKQTFEQYVDEWDGLREKAAKLVAQKTKLTKDIDRQLKEIAETELVMRKAIAESIKAALGDNVKEGVNRFDMVDGRTIKFTNAITRTVETAEIANARKNFSLLNDVPVEFDKLLRVKYELEKKEWNKLGDAAKKAISNMITAKPAAPTMEIE